MSPDGIMLHLITEELREVLLKGRVERIFQPGRQEIIITIRNLGKSWRLLLSVKAEEANLHLTTREKKNPQTPPQFCIILRKYLEGSRLIDIRQKGLDRVIQLTFKRIAESGEFQELVLVVEIMGKHSNLILYKPQNNQIIDGIKRYSHALSRYREVLPGHTYLSPPRQEKIDPSKLDEEKLISLMLNQPLNKPLDKALFSVVEGIGPLLAREIIIRANLDPNLRLEYCGTHELQSIWQILKDLLIPLIGGKNVEPIITLQGRQPIAYAPITLTQYQGLDYLSCKTINGMLDKFYTEQEEIHRFQQIHKHLAQMIKDQLSQQSKKLLHQEEDRTEATKALELRLWGETIFAHLHLIKPHSCEVSLPDIYNPEGPRITIQLDPSLTASQNAQKFFRKYNKARDSVKIINKKIKRTAAEIRYLNSVEMGLEQADTLTELREIQSELDEAGYLHLKEKKKQKKYRRKKETPQVKQFTSQDGFTIFVGKNNKQNDHITFKLAQDDEFWLHTKDIAGAHVIIKNIHGHKVPPATLNEAAELAAYYSKARFSSNVAVDCTLRRHVSKPKGAQPGFVIYREHETFYVTPQEPQNPK